MNHLGRPKGEPDPNFSLAPVAARLGELLGARVKLATDVVGPSAKATVESLGDGDSNHLRYIPNIITLFQFFN